MKSDNDYAARLKAAMERADIDPKCLAHRIGVSYQAAKKAVDGGSKSFSAANNVAAARALGVDSEWLATGEGDWRPMPLTPDLVARLRALSDTEATRLENELRVRFDLPLLPPTLGGAFRKPPPARAA